MKLQLIDERFDSAEKTQWVILGYIAVILTFGLAFLFAYERFWERRLFLNRKILADYIEENGLPSPELKAGRYNEFTIDSYRITLSPDKKWYIFKGKGNGIGQLIMTSFTGDIPAKKKYTYIQKKLMKKAGVNV